MPGTGCKMGCKKTAAVNTMAMGWNRMFDLPLRTAGVLGFAYNNLAFALAYRMCGAE